MSKRILWLVMALVMILATACEPTPTATPTAEPTLPPAPTNTAVPPTDTPEPALPVLTIVGLDGTALPFTMDELMALPVTEGYGGIKSSTGRITLPALYRGVSLKDLITVWGSMDDTMGISVVAEDGYAITYSFDQVNNGTFIAYDPATGDELQSAPALTAIIAYERDGEPLDAREEGTLRLAIVSAEPNQVTDGHWAVKWANTIELRDVGADWMLHLEGALIVDVDRSTFESGASPNCHMATWTDDKAQEWVGIPLWTLVGFVDDEVKHDGPAYSDALAAEGYTIDVVAADGYTVSFDSTRITRNDNIIVALSVNGNPLPDDYYPLRLVGGDLQKNEMVGNIVSIIVHVPGATGEGEPEAALEPELVIVGNVNQPQEFMENNLRELEVVEVTATHPKKGTTDTYTGVLFSTLMDLAVLNEGTTGINLVASDGYTASVALADLQACTDCLVTFTDTPGIFNAVMPTLDGSTWIKELVKIEVLPIPEPDLAVTGMVAKVLELTEADLRALDVVEITATHPKKGTTDTYEGVLFSTLTEMAGVQDGVTTVVVTASDGYAVEVAYTDLQACTDCLVTFTDEAGILNTVMPTLDGSTWVKDVVSIEFKGTPAPAAAVEGDLTVTGMVNTPLGLTEEDLRALEVVEISAVHPKKGTTDTYTGVLLNTLLTQAGVQSGAATLVLTAGDGYAVQLALADAQACADCIVAFTDTPGEFYLVMPGMESSFWVKNFVSIEVK